MQMTPITYETLILQGIADAGGQPEDIEQLQPEWLVELGKRAADAGAKKRMPNAEPTSGFLPLPKDGEVFELTIDGDAVDPIEMVRGDGYNDADQWKFEGPKVTGKQTKKFKRVNVGYQSNADAVNRALAKHGTPAFGQWREAFKERYGLQGITGFTGSEWVHPACACFFPCVLDGGSDFDYFGNDFSDDWCFVVEVK